MPKSTKPAKAKAAASKKSKPVVSTQPAQPPKKPAARRINLAAYNMFSRQNRELHRQAEPPVKLPNAWIIASRAYQVLRGNWKLFAGITLVYTLLTVLLVRGLSAGTDIASLKALLGGGISKFAGGLGVFAVLVSSSGNSTSKVAGVYQTFLTIIASLAVIWALRQVLAGTAEVRVRDAFYKGMYPLVPVLLVVLMIGLQLLPLVFGATLYSMLVSNGIAISLIERIFSLGIFLLLAVSSFYMITSSLFALYIATLPDMTPMKALRSARQLVRYRRFMVFRKVIFFPFLLLVGSAVIMLPIILVITPAAPWVFFLLSMIGLPVIHAYMYTLYRELLV